MRILRGGAFFLVFLFLFSFSISDVGDPAKIKSVHSIADLFVEESPSEINITPSFLEIGVYPNRTTKKLVQITSYRGNINITVQINITGNVTDYPGFLRFNENPVKVGVMTTKDIYALVNSYNVPVGNYTGNITFTVLESGYNVTIPVNVINDYDRGRFIITVRDEANKPLSNTYIELYKSLKFLEKGYTDRNGEYYTGYYEIGKYYIIVASKATYYAKATGKTLAEVDHYVNITLGGTPKLALYPQEYYTWMWVGDYEDMQLLLYNYGNGKERWIYIEPNVGWLHPNPSYFEELPPGEYRYINVRIGPFSLPGRYTGEIVADGLRSQASAKFYVDVYELGAGGGGGGVPPEYIPPTGPIIIVQPNVTIPPSAPEYFYKNPRVSIKTEKTLDLTAGVPYSFLVYVENVGDVDLNNLTLEASGIFYSETHPRSYYSLKQGEKRIFLVKVLATNLTSGSLSLRINSKELETYYTIPYTVSLGAMDPSSLLSEIGSLRQLLEAIDKELFDMFSKGYAVSGAFSFVEAINNEINSAEDSFEKKEYYNTRKWLDMAIKDIDSLWRMVDNIRKKGPIIVSDMSIVLLVIIIFICLVLLYYIRKKRKKK